MENFLSAILGELVSRSVNLFISRSSKSTVSSVENSMQRALLQARVILDEAMGLHITNHAMLQQLEILRDAMHRGCYVLDTFRYQSHDDEEEDNARDQAVSHSWSLSRLNSLKGIYSSRRKTSLFKQLQESLDDLSSMVLDVKELVRFLMSYPRLYSQPYSMHLILGNCMFGFQMETELVINFLLQTEPHGSQQVDVLPIVGPSKVGKSTLVAHVCRNPRVRDHFSEILLLHDHDFTDDDISTFQERCATNHQVFLPNSNKEGRLLVVVDLDGDISEVGWNMLYSTCKQHTTSKIKIIITSRSNKITKLGTTQAVNLKYVPREAFWYFFKTITFGSMDPEKHPKLAHLAMEIGKMLGRSLIGANITSCLLRDNFDVHFWSKVLAFLRDLVQKHISKFGFHPSHLLMDNKPVQIRRMATPFQDFVFFYEYKRCSQEEVPEIRFQDVVYGNLKAVGKFKVLAWRSQMPPYYSYVVSCDIRELKITGTKRKRSVKNSGSNNFA